MRDIRFRYRILCELVTGSGVEDKILPYYLSLKDVEDRNFLQRFKSNKGNIKILQVVSRDQYTEFLDMDGNELYEGDKCLFDVTADGKIGYIVMYKGKWSLEIDIDTKKEWKDLYSISFCIKKVGTKYGDDESGGELRKYYAKDLDEIL